MSSKHDKAMEGLIQKSYFPQESNSTANFILHSAEQKVQVAVSLAEPVFMTFQKSLMVTDNLICNTMDKLVESNAKAKEAQLKVSHFRSETSSTPKKTHFRLRFEYR